MMYPFIPIGLIAVFIVVVLYLAFFKKDKKKLQAVLYPGLLFMAVWSAIYLFWLR